MNDSKVVINPHPIGTLNRVIWNSLWYYPMLYTHGGHVLNHLFCVIGNGYEWQDGRLVNIFLNDDQPSNKGVYPDEPKTVDNSSYLNIQFKVDWLLKKAHIDFVRQNIDLLVEDRQREWYSLYPVCEYSRLCNVPDNVQPDFLDGARVSIDLAYGVLMREGHVSVDIYKSQQRLNDMTWSCIRILDNALDGIIRRFGNRTGPSNGYLQWTNFEEFCAFRQGQNSKIHQILSAMLRKYE